VACIIVLWTRAGVTINRLTQKCPVDPAGEMGMPKYGLYYKRKEFE